MSTAVSGSECHSVEHTKLQHYFDFVINSLFIHRSLLVHMVLYCSFMAEWRFYCNSSSYILFPSQKPMTVIKHQNSL